MYRLQILGVVKDYTIDFSEKNSEVSIARFNRQKIKENFIGFASQMITLDLANKELEKVSNIDENFDFIVETARILIQIIYNNIEKGRRRATYESINLFTREKLNDEIIRKYILNYFEKTTYTEILEEILKLKDGGISQIIKLTQDSTVENVFTKLLKEVDHRKNAEKLRGEAIRLLESYPKNPGLILIRSFSELFCEQPDFNLARQEFIYVLDILEKEFKIQLQEVFKFALGYFILIEKKSYEIISHLDEFIYQLLKKYPSKDFAMKMLENLSPNLWTVPTTFLLGILSIETNMLLNKIYE